MRQSEAATGVLPFWWESFVVQPLQLDLCCSLQAFLPLGKWCAEGVLCVPMKTQCSFSEPRAGAFSIPGVRWWLR